MFVRVRKQPGKYGPIRYAYLVNNQWNPVRRKHEQKVLMSLGKADDLPVTGTIEKAISALDSFANKMGFASLHTGVVLSDLTDESLLTKTYEYGTVLLTRFLLRQLSFTTIFTQAWERSKKERQLAFAASKEKRTEEEKKEHLKEEQKQKEQTNKEKEKPFLSLQKYLKAVEALISYRLYPRTAASDLGTYRWYANDVFFGNKKDKKGLGKESLPHENQGKKEYRQQQQKQAQEQPGTDIPLNKDDLYMSLDVLLANKDAIEQSYYEQNKDLFTEELDLVLFGTTSIYYYGATSSPTQDTDLLQYGHSKDGKGDEKQVIVGVLMTKGGVPIAHEVFPGNTADVKTFAKIITIIKHKYQLKQIILIADRGMISEENLLHLESLQYSYLVGVRMRKLPGVLQKKLLEPLDSDDGTADMEQIRQARNKQGKTKPPLYSKEGTLKNFSDHDLEKLFVNNILKKKTTTFDKTKLLELIRKRRYFVCYNPEEAKKTQEKRKYFTDILNKKISNTATKDWIVKNGYKKYLTFPDGIKPQLDKQRLKDEEIFDGKWVLITNDQAMNVRTAGLYYKSLQVIERGFRDLKSLITVRPIYHWKEERIRAHIFVCFLSLITKWYLCRQLAKESQEEGRRFIEEMINLKAIAIDESIPLYVRTAISPEVQEQMKKLGMTIPAKIILDGRKRGKKVNPKGGRPRKMQQGQYSIPFQEKQKEREEEVLGEKKA